MPTYSSYDGIELTYPDPADWADAENVVAKDGKTFNMTPAQFAILAQVGMAETDHTHAIADVTDLQTALDAKRNVADVVPVVSEDAGNVITAGTDGLAYLSGELLGDGGIDLAGYATEVYVDEAVAGVDLTPYATNERVDALEQTITLGLADLAEQLEGI